MKTQEQLSNALSELVGMSCVGHMAGGAAGSHISLEFGPRVPRPQTLRNPTLSEEQRLTESEYSLFVLCSWRLDSELEVVCGAWDDNSEGGPMLRGLDQLVGKHLEAFIITAPGLDLELRFPGLFLRVFCDNVNHVDQEDNYSVFMPDQIITVTTRSRIERELRDAEASSKL